MTTNCLLTHQLLLEELYAKFELLPRVRREFEEEPSFNIKKYIKSHGIDVKFGIDLMAQMSLHKRCDLPTLIGVLRHHCKNSQETADWILKCAEADLVDWSPDLKRFIVRHELTPDVVAELERYQYPLPMVVRPLLVENNMQRGYYHNTGSVILRDNHHDDDVCLDHINRANQVQFVLNMDVVTFIQNKWRNLDKPKAGETKEEFEARKRAFNKYDRSARDVIKLINKLSTVFYLTHRYDKRGRTYCQGYHVNYQGTAWNKACVEFANKEIIED